jgi:hypothetical protein
MVTDNKVTQNLSFLKRKSAAACFSLAPSGLVYLNATQSYYLIAKWEGGLPSLQLLLELSLHRLAGLRGGHLLIGDDVLEVQIILDDKSGWQNVVVVHELDEGLEPALSIDFLLVHALGDPSGGALDSDDESVGELLVLNKTLLDKTRLPSCHHRLVSQ